MEGKIGGFRYKRPILRSGESRLYPDCPTWAMRRLRCRSLGSQGCNNQCAKLMIHRFKGDDIDLENHFKSAKKDLEKFQKYKRNKQVMPDERK